LKRLSTTAATVTKDVPSEPACFSFKGGLAWFSTAHVDDYVNGLFGICLFSFYGQGLIELPLWALRPSPS
jgi:hypothetical protein